MNRIISCTGALASALFLGLVAGTAAHASDTYVNLSVGGQLQPGVYGAVNIGNAPPPPVVYARPIIAVPQPVTVVAPPPAYLYVPPGHQKHWGKHCARYNACGRPVYFVNVDSRGRYVQPRGPRPQYHEAYRDDRGHGGPHDHGHGHGKGHDKHRD